MPSNHFIFCCPLLLLPSIFPSIRVFQMSQFFASGGQSIGISTSASVLPMNIQDWFPLGWTGWISLQTKGLSRISSNTTVQKHNNFLYVLYFRLETKKIGYEFISAWSIFIIGCTMHLLCCSILIYFLSFCFFLPFFPTFAFLSLSLLFLYHQFSISVSFALSFLGNLFRGFRMQQEQRKIWFKYVALLSLWKFCSEVIFLWCHNGGGGLVSK